MNVSRCRILLFLLTLAALPVYAKRAPNLDLKNIDGQAQKLAALRGQIVVLNFWATWCGPCQEELPRLSQMAQSYSGKNVRFVAVSIDEAKNRAKIQPTLEKENVKLETWVGATTDTMADFGLGDIVPGTVIVDERGEIVARIMGEARDEDVRSAVDWLLNGRSGPAPAAMTKRY
jgi:thiol-disulfide isomerase/thioredoxin